MKLEFTRSDAATFAIGLLAVIVWQVGTALVNVDVLTDWGSWWDGLRVGLLASGGRYLITYLSTKGFKDL